MTRLQVVADDVTGEMDPVVENRITHRLSPGPGVIGQIGASISSNGSLSYYDRALSGTISYGALAVMAFALPKTGGRFTAGGVAATNGYTTTQMIATHLPTVLASDWDYCIVGEVTNDLGNGFAIETTRANILTIIEALLAANKIPILTTVPPSDANASGAGLTWITQYNEWVKRTARILRVPIADYHHVLTQSALNTYRSGFSSDGVHPTANGVAAMGELLAAVLNAIPGPVRSSLEPSYNPNLLLPDVTVSSVGSDKMVGSGNTTGLYYGLQTSAKWRGSSPILSRGTVGDYAALWPVGALIPGHRVRLAFGIQVPYMPALSTWSAYLTNLTKGQVTCGYAAVTGVIHDGTATGAIDGVTVSGSNKVTCASKPFRPNMAGNTIAALSTGLTNRFPAGTTILNVSADGTEAYCSANASASSSACRVVVLGAPQVSCFEFTVPDDVAGDTFTFRAAAGGAADVVVVPTQPTLIDLTALGAAA